MKMRMETLPTENPGIIITSETTEEAQRLKDIWSGHGAIVSFMRYPDHSIELIVAPTPKIGEVEHARHL